MAGLGLIGTALAGAAKGVGNAATQYGDYLERSTLQTEAAAIQTARDEALARAAVAAEERGYGHAEKLQTERIGAEKEIAGQQATAETQRYEETRLRSIQQHAESLAATNAQMTVAMMNASDIPKSQQIILNGLVRSSNTAIMEAGRAGASLAAIDPRRDPERYKEFAGQQKQFLDSAKEMSDKAQAMVASIGKKEGTKEVKQPVRNDLEVTGIESFAGIDGFEAPTGRQPNSNDIAGLRQRANNPDAIKKFENFFGKGSAAKYLGQ